MQHDVGEESSDLSLQTMELQWKDYVTKLKESGTLSSALAIADVSGSMCGEPMEVLTLTSLCCTIIQYAVMTMSADRVIQETHDE